MAGERGAGPKGQGFNQTFNPPTPPLSLPQLHAWFMGVCTEITLIFQVSVTRDRRSPSLPEMGLPRPSLSLYPLLIPRYPSLDS